MMRFQCFFHLRLESGGAEPAALSAEAGLSASIPVDPGPDAMDVDLRGNEDDD